MLWGRRALVVGFASALMACGGEGGSSSTSTSSSSSAPVSSSSLYGEPFTGTFQGTFSNPVKRSSLPMTIQSTQNGTSASGTFVLGSHQGSLSGRVAAHQLVGSLVGPTVRCTITLDRSSLLLNPSSTVVDGGLSCGGGVGTGGLNLTAL